MQTPFDIATGYLAVWNEASALERRQRLAAWHPDVEYRDPLMEAKGREGIAAMIEATRERLPGLAFTLLGTPDGHGPFVRFLWMLGPDRGLPVAAGTDIARIDANGRLVEVTGFLDEVSA